MTDPLAPAGSVTGRGAPRRCPAIGKAMHMNGKDVAERAAGEAWTRDTRRRAPCPRSRRLTRPCGRATGRPAARLRSQTPGRRDHEQEGHRGARRRRGRDRETGRGGGRLRRVRLHRRDARAPPGAAPPHREKHLHRAVVRRFLQGRQRMRRNRSGPGGMMLARTRPRGCASTD